MPDLLPLTFCISLARDLPCFCICSDSHFYVVDFPHFILKFLEVLREVSFRFHSLLSSTHTISPSPFYMTSSSLSHVRSSQTWKRENWLPSNNSPRTSISLPRLIHPRLAKLQAQNTTLNRHEIQLPTNKATTEDQQPNSNHASLREAMRVPRRRLAVHGERAKGTPPFTLHILITLPMLLPFSTPSMLT